MTCMRLDEIEPLFHDKIGVGYALAECDKWWVVIIPVTEPWYRRAYALATPDRERQAFGLDWMDDMLMFDDWREAQAFAEELRTSVIARRDLPVQEACRANFGDICRSGRVEGERCANHPMFSSSRVWWSWSYA